MSDRGKLLSALYTTRFDERLLARKAAIWRVLVQHFFSRFIPADGCVLDLGCGEGEFINAVQAHRRIAVDLQEEVRSRLAPEVELHCGGIDDLSFLPDASVDTVFLSNVLEHLPSRETVERVFQEVRRVLKPEVGRVLILGPNIRLVGGAYWDFWDHIIPVTERSLYELLETSGYRVEQCLPRFLPYTTLSRIPQTPLLVRMYLMFPFAWRFLGKQFFLVASPVARR